MEREYHIHIPWWKIGLVILLIFVWILYLWLG